MIVIVSVWICVHNEYYVHVYTCIILCTYISVCAAYEIWSPKSKFLN